jgi:hypothetical protein
MKIVVLTTRLTDLPRSGGDICTFRLVQELQRSGHQLTVVGRGKAFANEAEGIASISVGPLVPPFAEWSWRRRLRSLLGDFIGGRASTVSRLFEDGAGPRVESELRLQLKSGFDVLVIDHLQAFAWIRPLLGSLPPPLLVMHNLESEGYLDRAAGSGGAQPGNWLSRAFFRREARLLARLEQQALCAAAAVACLSESDASLLRKRLAAQGAAVPVEVLPGFPLGWPGNTAHSAPPLSFEAQGEARVPERLVVGSDVKRRIGMIGTWTWGPNRQALHWMLSRVLPKLPRSCGLVLAGTGLESIAIPTGIEVLGRVRDAQTFYAGIDLVAIPSLQGSGVQEKAIEAIGSGRLVVGTSHALRGLTPPTPLTVHVCDEPKAFARACAETELPPSEAAAASVASWVAHRQTLYRAALDRCVSRSAVPLPGAAVDAGPATEFSCPTGTRD